MVRGPRLALALVAGAYAVAQLAIVPLGRLFLGRDEAIYLSQVTPGVPALDMAIHRTRGMSLLVAPIAPWGDSPVALRGYMTVLATVGIYLAFRPWLRSLGWGAPIAALLFAGHFVNLVFGTQLYPNFMTAIALVAVLGHIARFVIDRNRLDAVVLVPWVALASLIRPLDTVLVTVAAAVVLLLIARRDLVAVVLALMLGGVLGFTPWVIEGAVRYDLAPWETPFAAEESGAAGRDHESNTLAYLNNSDGPMRCVVDCPDEVVADGLDMPLREQLIFLGLAGAVGLALFDDPRRVTTRSRYLPAAALVALLAYYLTCDCAINWRYLSPALGMTALLAGTGIQRGWGLVAGLPWRVGGFLRGLVVLALLAWGAHSLQLAQGEFENVSSRERAYELATILRDRAEGEPCAVAAAVSDRQIQYYSGCIAVALRRGDDGYVQHRIGGTTSIHDLQLLHEAGYRIFALARPRHIGEDSPIWDWKVEDISSDPLGEYRLFHAPDDLELESRYRAGYTPEQAGPP